MKYSCPNCLEPTDEQGSLCEKCRSVWWTTNRIDAMGCYCTDVTPYDNGVDELYIKSLRERRMASYARARRMAQGGR